MPFCCGLTALRTTAALFAAAAAARLLQNTLAHRRVFHHKPVAASTNVDTITTYTYTYD
jgi:hypothetical protein